MAAMSVGDHAMIRGRENPGLVSHEVVAGHDAAERLHRHSHAGVATEMVVKADEAGRARGLQPAAAVRDPAAGEAAGLVDRLGVPADKADASRAAAADIEPINIDPATVLDRDAADGEVMAVDHSGREAGRGDEHEFRVGNREQALGGRRRGRLDYRPLLEHQAGSRSEPVRLVADRDRAREPDEEHRLAGFRAGPIDSVLHIGR